MSNEAIQTLLVVTAIPVLGALLYAHRTYRKLLLAGKINLKTIFGTYSIEEVGHGFSFLGVGKQLQAVVELPIIAPEFYIDAYKNEKPLFNAPQYYARTQRLQLEGDFSDYFDVYVPEGCQQEALQILTPDLMLYLRDTLHAYDIHILSNRLYVSCLKKVSNEAALTEAVERVSQRLYRVFHGRRQLTTQTGLLPTLKKDPSTEALRIFGFRIKARLLGMILLCTPLFIALAVGLITGTPLLTVLPWSLFVAGCIVFMYKKGYLK